MLMCWVLRFKARKQFYGFCLIARLSGLILPPSQCHQKQRRLAFFYVNNKYIVSGVGKLIAGIHALYHTLSSGKPTLQYVFHLEVCYQTNSLRRYVSSATTVSDVFGIS